jgi:Mg2+ and Co2+ transporter CorA
MIDDELESWENHFLGEAADAGGPFVGVSIERLQRQLSLLAGAIATSRLALRTLRRRADIQPGFPGPVGASIRRNHDELMKHSQAQRRVVRESFGLVASVTAGQEFRLAQVRADRDGAFQAAIGLIAAVFVAPGLIAAIYGANVRGLPGLDRTTGLWFMLVGAVGSALLSLVLIAVVRHFSRRPRS